MNSIWLNRLVVILIGALLASYFVLNSRKLAGLDGNFEFIMAGESAATFEVSMGNDKAYTVSLPSMGIIDVSGKRQLMMHLLDEKRFNEWMKARDQIQVTVNEAVAKVEVNQQGTAMIAVSDQHKLIVAPENQFQIAASLLWSQDIERQPFEQCFGDMFCKTIRVVSQDWSSPQGPYTQSELMPSRRGLPRGRWLKAPVTKLDVQSLKKQNVVLYVELLSILPNIKPVLNGSVVSVKPVEPPVAMLTFGGRAYYPLAVMIEMELKQNNTELQIDLSESMQKLAAGNLPAVVYMTALKVKQK